MTLANRSILVTGANGFIGRNVVVRLTAHSTARLSLFVRGDDFANVPQLVAGADAVIHLAGEIRPANDAAFHRVNSELTSVLCTAIQQKYSRTGSHVPLVLASSTQASLDNPYGRSKFAAEQSLRRLSEETGNPCVAIRLPGVFGKWCRPNYNSVVATFCHNIARGLPIEISDPSATLHLVYIDDAVTALIDALDPSAPGYTQTAVAPEYTTTLGDLANQIRCFADARTTLIGSRVGSGLLRALYATYLSHLPSDAFSYKVPRHADERGAFVELLKTPDSGQFSYFTAHPGATRGGHYHHTKTEKFLVVRGEARFRFRHVLTDEVVELRTSDATPQIVDTVPGWAHEITNVGDGEMIVMLWANEPYQRDRPDTVTSKV
jgi:UDP-2-acetamido-2,6-beta-L-arabino-hexul-4-ose reductase